MCVQGLDMKFKDYDAVLNECVNHKSLRGGQRVQAHMMKTHYLPPVYLRTRLIVLYVKCEVLSDARMVFDEMPERNVVSWTAMISGYTKSELYSEALSLFVEMIRSGIFLEIRLVRTEMLYSMRKMMMDHSCSAILFAGIPAY
ncbi:UNVERIFIED_CONTAM: putative pentatricopeptide repeat-containing protein, mitochondrial [Sesamum angustifolium]|uniref:Pentatricopeptide repeat-containing protein, mitochondrial n=1 Tax=Sesamum angustifolium TaxID=2727405 RepID=A0AAW2MRE2_9LAMI